MKGKSNYTQKIKDIGKDFFAKVIGSENLDDISPTQAMKGLFWFNVILICVGIVHGTLMSRHDPGYYFREGRPLTILSFLQLIFIGVIARRIWQCSRLSEMWDWKDPAIFWRLLSYGFYFLSADELLKIHENTEKLIHIVLHMKKTPLTSYIDDMLIISYGLIMCGLTLVYFKHLWRFAVAWKYFLAAVVMSIVYMIVDLANGSKPIWLEIIHDENTVNNLIITLAIFEESFKNFAEILYIGVAAACLRVVKKESICVAAD